MGLIGAHRDLAIALLAALSVVFALWCFAGYVADRAHREDAALIAKERQKAADSATVAALRAVAAVRARNDSLSVANDSLSRIANERRTAANVVRSRLTVRGDTAVLSTDSGAVQFAIPPELARQLAAERLVTDSAFAAMDHKMAGDSTLIAGLRTQIQLDSVVVARYRSELATVQAQLDQASKESHPRFSFTQGVIAGTLGTLAGVVAIAVVF